MYTERIRQATPMGMTISAARPASPTGSTMKPVNVLSEPHLPMGISPQSASPNAVTRLQQTLDKSDTKTFVDLKLEADDLCNSPIQRNSSGSGASMRVATSAAREMVAGLFGRRKKSNNSLIDGHVGPEVSESPASSLANVSRAGDSDEEYLYNVATQAPLSYATDFVRRRSSNSSRQLEQKAVTYINFTPFGSPSTIRKSPTCPTGSISPLEETNPNEESSSVFSPLTLTQSRCDNRMRATRTSTVHSKPKISKSRKSVQQIFMSSGHGSSTKQDLLPLGSKDSAENTIGQGTLSVVRSRSGPFRSPARSLIRQSSTCSSLSNLVDFPAASSHSEVSVHGSGRVALTNVLASPKFSKTTSQKITSLSPVNYKLPDSDGYISFPPFVPGSYFGGSLANIFGRNENLSSRGTEPKRAPAPSHVLRRTLINLAPRDQNPAPVVAKPEE